jgi:hypothetical protein
MASGKMVIGSMASGIKASGKRDTSGKIDTSPNLCLLIHNQLTTRAGQ